MIIRRWARVVEKHWLRPLGRLLPRGRRGTAGDRISHLEARVDELESLVRELTGLAYLQLDAPPADHHQAPRGPATREAA
ncbi:MAG: hypothetical protein FJ284_09320 [Planctomycetes bacterium]|nr:hypothetical protein [Planctomycetota bacterium]